MSDYIPRFDLNLLASQDDEGNMFDLNEPVDAAVDVVFDFNEPADVDADIDADAVLHLDEQLDDDANDVLNLDEPEDHHGGNASLSCILPLFRLFLVLIICFIFFTVLDLNLPVDEFGAVDFDYIQNQAGNFFSSQCLFFFL